MGIRDKKDLLTFVVWSTAAELICLGFGAYFYLEHHHHRYAAVALWCIGIVVACFENHVLIKVLRSNEKFDDEES